MYDIVCVMIKFKWFVKGYNHYQFSIDKKLYNTKNNREIKRTVIGYTIGYCIGGKFHSLKKLKPLIQIIKHEKLPF